MKKLKIENIDWGSSARFIATISEERRTEWIKETFERIQKANMEPGPYWCSSGDSLLFVFVEENGTIEITDAKIRRNGLLFVNEEPLDEEKKDEDEEDEHQKLMKFFFGKKL